MGLTTFVLTSLIAALGILLGFFIAKYTTEEVKEFEKFLLVLQEFLIAILIYLALSWTLPVLYAALIGTIAFVVLCLISLLAVPKCAKTTCKFIKSCRTVYGMYALLALDLVASSKYGQTPLIASIIFLYGLPAGSRMNIRCAKLQHVLIPALTLVVLSTIGFVLI